MVLRFFKSGVEKIKGALSRAGSLLGDKLRTLFKGKIDAETLERLEQTLYEADLGVQTAVELTEKIRTLYQQNPSLDAETLIQELQKDVLEILSQLPPKLLEVPPQQAPRVILIVGVNGNGKTTSVAKLAHYLHSQHQEKVLIAAADTFRAAAIEQLDIWAKEIGVEIVKGAPNCDAAAVAFDALTAAKARQIDTVIIDTAGRLHTRRDLMQELDKIKRACQKVHPGSPHETLLVLDATVGQNAIDQAQTFHQFTPITGLILTKLDGTAKGGIVVNIQQQLEIPVKFVGIGEQIEDLEEFNPEIFAASLLS